MKRLDRYILVSIAGTFLFGIAMFMGLLMAMDLMRKLVTLIAEQGVPAGIALKIFAYRIPGMLAYAFPMSVLLSILLVFNRMSSESEMVAIRAAGISFARAIVPALLFALLVSGATYFISDYFAPYAGQRATDLTRQALEEMRAEEPIQYAHQEEGRTRYTVIASDLDIKSNQMRKVVLMLYRDGVPSLYVYADHAEWQVSEGRWIFHPPYLVRSVDPARASGFLLEPLDDQSRLDVGAYAMRLKESPFDLYTGKKRPEDMTSVQLRQYAERLRDLGQSGKDVGKWEMNMFERYATPLSCLVFALIGAPLGLRHHRTSSAVGLGISLLVIFAYYFFSVYMHTFGENQRMPAMLAAWLPNILGGILGVVLIVRANQ